MKRHARPSLLRATAEAKRAFEVLVGALVSVPALFFLTTSLGAVAALLAGPARDRSDWRIWAGAALGSVVGLWCAQIAWRLFTRHERRGGGLLSPLVLVVFGIGCLAASIAIFVYRDPRNLTWIRLLALAFACFGLARYRYHRERVTA